MIKVYENFDITQVGAMQSILESNGIRTHIKNYYSAGALGELPFVEICPQLYVLEESDVPRAKRLLQVDQPEGEKASDWVCPKCETENEGQFQGCWNCGTYRDDG